MFTCRKSKPLKSNIEKYVPKCFSECQPNRLLGKTVLFDKIVLMSQDMLLVLCMIFYVLDKYFCPKKNLKKLMLLEYTEQILGREGLFTTYYSPVLFLKFSVYVKLTVCWKIEQNI